MTEQPDDINAMLADADRALREKLGTAPPTTDVPPRVLAAEDRARFRELLAASSICSICQHTDQAEREAMAAARRWLAALPDRWMDVDDLPRLLGVYRDRRESWGEDHDTAVAYTLTEADYEPSQPDLDPPADLMEREQ